MGRPRFELERLDRQYSDNRSSSIARKRGRDEYHKYFKFRHVDPRSRNHPHYTTTYKTPWGAVWPADKTHEDVTIIPAIPKRDFYKLARDISLPSYCRCCQNHKKSKQRKKDVEFIRGSRYARELASSYTRTGQALRPALWTGDVDHIYYMEDDRCRPEWECSYCENPEESSVTWFDYDEEEDAEPLFSVNEVDDDTMSVFTTGTIDWTDVGSVASWEDYDMIIESASECSDLASEDFSLV